jgi:hypothetical protein
MKRSQARLACCRHVLQRAEFIRQAVKDAIRKREYQAIRKAYLRQPDSADDADDWSNADAWKPGSNTRSGGRIGRSRPGVAPSFC